MAANEIAAFNDAIDFNRPNADHEGSPYFPSAQEGQNGSAHVVDRNREARGVTENIIYSIYEWGDILVSSYKTLLAIGFCLVEMDERDSMTFEVLSFVTQAARDCAIRAKDVMGAVHGDLQIPNPRLRISGKVIAMGMGHYRRHGRPCNGFHELFFNGLVQVLHGTLGANFRELERNADLFAAGQFGVSARGGRYILDTMVIEYEAGMDMCRLEFDRNDFPIRAIRANATVRGGGESDESAMDE